MEDRYLPMLQQTEYDSLIGNIIHQPGLLTPLGETGNKTWRGLLSKNDTSNIEQRSVPPGGSLHRSTTSQAVRSGSGFGTLQKFIRKLYRRIGVSRKG